MEPPTAGGDPHPSRSGGASPPSPPPPPPPPPPTGWLAGLVSGAGRLLASVLGPDDSSPTRSGTAASGGSASSSPSPHRRPRARGEGHYGGTDHDDSMRFPSKNNQLNQSEKETVPKGYTEASLAIISDIEPKDAIMQLLMQETYSRSECTTLIKIIQERVVDPDSGGVIDGDIPLPIIWKPDRQQTLGYSPIHRHVFDNNAAADAVPTITPARRGLFNHNTDNIHSTSKRSYSVVRDTPEDVRRVRPKIDGNPINIAKFKQVGVVRNRPGGDQKYNEPTFFKSCANKVEPLNDLISFERKMVDLSHQKHKDAACDDSGSVSKLMFMEDIEATPSLQMGLPLQNGLKNRRRKQPNSPRTTPPKFTVSPAMVIGKQSNSPRTTPKISVSPGMGTGKQSNSARTSPKISEPPAMGTRKQSNSPRTTPKISESPAMGTRSKISDATVKAEIDLLEQTRPVSNDKQDPDYVPGKRPVGRTRKGK